MKKEPQSQLPAFPEQLLEPETYVSAEWYAREQKELFAKCWVFAGVTSDLASPGDYVTVRAGPHSLAVVCGRDHQLRAFHNICRHRGTEILDGAGNIGRAIVCPYHFWAYGLDGSLKGITDKSDCFPDLELDVLSLHAAGLGCFRDLVFVNADPQADFQAWLSGLADIGWPHHLADLVETRAVTYEMNCNWKVFYENAIDGYHLKYLHKDTLGGPAPQANAWEVCGQHLVWYSTEYAGRKSALPQAVATYLEARDTAKIHSAEASDYGGVYMLFPTTIVLPNPYNFSISQLLPQGPERTLLRSRVWGLPGSNGRASQDIDASEQARDPQSGHIKLEFLDVHPKQSGDFQLEDMWICEKVQRALHSPKFRVTGLARGAGGEATLAFFQQQILAALEERPE